MSNTNSLRQRWNNTQETLGFDTRLPENYSKHSGVDVSIEEPREENCYLVRLTSFIIQNFRFLLPHRSDAVTSFHAASVMMNNYNWTNFSLYRSVLKLGV
jgi:hypothetical protein